MAYSGRYFLNNRDMFLDFGFMPLQGCEDTLMQERERKEPYSNDWPEHNGREFDLLAPVKFKERQFKFPGIIKAANYADYAAKLAALKAELFSGVCEVKAPTVPELKANALAMSIKTIKIVDTKAVPCPVQIEIYLTEVFI